VYGFVSVARERKERKQEKQRFLGGEDSKLCIWSTQAAPSEAPSAAGPPSSGPVASPATEQRKQQRKFNPY